MVQFLLLCSALTLSSCVGNFLRESPAFARELQELPIIDDIVVTDPDLSTLAVAFQAADLVGRLCTNCNYTFFAPTNEALAAFDQGFLALLLTPSWILHLQNFLAFHATVPATDRLLTTEFTDGQVLDMLNSEVLTVNLLKRGITLTSPLTVGSGIVEADILASNGALNKIDEILSPGFFGVDVFALGDKYDEFTILQELIELIGLEGTKGEFTVLAPTNDAFLALGNETLEALREDTKALGKILANHVIVGVYPSMFLTDGLVLESLGGLNITVGITNSTVVPGASVVMFNDATVLLADILAKNGIAHAIDMVLMNSDTVSDVPSDVPSDMPSTLQSDVPSDAPSDMPSDSPSGTPSSAPSLAPSLAPSMAPSSGGMMKRRV
jgi:transforming growth factor-beta-induced protein